MTRTLGFLTNKQEAADEASEPEVSEEEVVVADTTADMVQW